MAQELKQLKIDYHFKKKECYAAGKMKPARFSLSIKPTRALAGKGRNINNMLLFITFDLEEFGAEPKHKTLFFSSDNFMAPIQ